MSGAREGILGAVRAGLGGHRAAAAAITAEAHALLEAPELIRPELVDPDLVTAFTARASAPAVGTTVERVAGLLELPDAVRRYLDHHGLAARIALQPAAALAALQVYRQGNTYPRLHELGKYLREQLRSLLESRGIEATVLGDGPLAQVAFTDAEVRDYRTSRHRDPSFARELMLALFRQGMFLNPMGTKFYLSLAHDESACDEFCANFALCLEGVLSEV